MGTSMNLQHPPLIRLLALMFLLIGCNPAGPPTATNPPISKATLPPPSPTPIPLASLVNGEPITLADYESELGRFEAAQATLGINLATLEDYEATVLQALIDRKLLAQGALASGAVVQDQDLEDKIGDLSSDTAGQDGLSTWLANNGYTLETFKAALREEMLAAKMIEAIVAQVPENGEHVHARHILVGTQQEADAILQRVLGGSDFAELARGYSLDPSTRIAGGDLGWFARGSLTMPEVEEVAFSLEPGQTSQVVSSSLGFHIIQTLATGERPYDPSTLRWLKEQAVKDWLADQSRVAQIEILVAE